MSRREMLTNQLLNLKAEGFRVFINTPSTFMDSNYGIITDGKDFIYVQFGEYGSSLFVTSFEYVPSKKNGSGCQTIEPGYGYENLTRKVFNEAVAYGRRFAAENGAELYRNIDHYFSDRWRKERYTEL